MSERKEQINQLLDGELDAMHEAALYGELAVNEELRTELREQIAVKSAVKDDRMALVPPASLTNSVFSGLGFTAPLAGAAAGSAGGSLLLQWLMRLGLPILSAIAAAGISFGLSDAFTNQDIVVQDQRTLQGEEAKRLQGEEATVIDDKLVADLTAENEQLRAQLDELRGQLATAGDRVETRTVVETRDPNPELQQRLVAALAENDDLRRQLAEAETVSSTVAVADVQDQTPVVVPEPRVTSFTLNNSMQIGRQDEPRAIQYQAIGIPNQRGTYPTLPSTTPWHVTHANCEHVRQRTITVVQQHRSFCTICAKQEHRIRRGVRQRSVSDGIRRRP